MRKNKGYTLVELIIALALSGVILVGVLAITTSMIRFSIQSSTRGDITGWTALGLDKMNREIENASYIDWSTFPSDYLTGCTNWSATMRSNSSFAMGKMDASTGKTVGSFYYCRAPISGMSPAIPMLLRYYNDNEVTSCPMAPPAACGDAAAVGYTREIIAKGVYKTNPASGNFFSRSTRVPNAVHVEFIVGVATPTLTGTSPNPGGAVINAGSGQVTPMPTYLKIDTDIRLGISLSTATN